MEADEQTLSSNPFWLSGMPKNPLSSESKNVENEPNALLPDRALTEGLELKGINGPEDMVGSSPHFC